MCCIWRACPCPCGFLFFIFFQPSCGMDSTTDPTFSRAPFLGQPAVLLASFLFDASQPLDCPTHSLLRPGSSTDQINWNRLDHLRLHCNSPKRMSPFTWMCYTTHLVFCHINLKLVFLISYKLGSGTGRGGRARKVQSIDTKLYIKCWHSKLKSISELCW